MEPIGIGLFAVVAGSVAWSKHRDRRRSTKAKRKVRRDLTIADQQISLQFHQARRAMNDAAGQSWRNLAG